MTREKTVKHTTGPWEWLRDGKEFFLSPGVLITGFADGTPWGDEIDQSNARLIAAAPDLLEALMQTADLIERIIGNQPWGAIEEYLDDARAAIAKAEGRS